MTFAFLSRGNSHDATDMERHDFVWAAERAGDSCTPGERSVDLCVSACWTAATTAPVRYERVNSETGEEVPWKEIVKGFEYSGRATTW